MMVEASVFVVFHRLCLGASQNEISAKFGFLG